MRGSDPAARKEAAKAWLVEAALPLWSGAGFEASSGLFEEQLTFDHAPVTAVPRRLMVQARQIAVFADASLSGAFPTGGVLAIEAMQRVIDLYLEGDGKPGWVFSLDRRGALFDGKRDLYAHAFVLFALAFAMRLERRPVFEDAVDKTLAFLDAAFADPRHGGFWDSLPRADALRRQNPHMHLFEAMIALWETTGRPDILARGKALRDLALARFYDPGSGALREVFFEDWRVHPAAAAGSVEPGHLFEWAWLLRRWQAASGMDESPAVERLLALALRAGLDATRGRIIDEIGEDGRPRRLSSRSWPHAEALKALSAEAEHGTLSQAGLVDSILQRVMAVYCPARLRGGWIDHVDHQDTPLVSIMPASTLYHLYFGITAVLR